MEQIHKEFNQKGLTVLAVNVQENRDRVANWVEEKNVTSLILLDADGGGPVVWDDRHADGGADRPAGRTDRPCCWFKRMDGGERPRAFRGSAVSSGSLTGEVLVHEAMADSAATH
jgi:hypothetical protein